jgi:hypothetical protein
MEDVSCFATALSCCRPRTSCHLLGPFALPRAWDSRQQTAVSERRKWKRTDNSHRRGVASPLPRVSPVACTDSRALQIGMSRVEWLEDPTVCVTNLDHLPAVRSRSPAGIAGAAGPWLGPAVYQGAPRGGLKVLYLPGFAATHERRRWCLARKRNANRRWRR